MLMRHPDGGWHNADALEIAAMEKSGWLKSCEEERQSMIAAKHALDAVRPTLTLPKRRK